MKSEFNIQQVPLRDYMSIISERCYYAGWMNNLEYILWHSTSAGPRNYGHDFITAKDILTLSKMATASNSWIIFDGLLGEIAISLKEWELKYHNDLIRKSKILLEG